MINNFSLIKNALYWYNKINYKSIKKISY